MPKFEYEAQLDLKQTLREMGMPAALGPEADFSGITGDRSLSIEQVTHKASVSVDEQGTESLTIPVERGTTAGSMPGRVQSSLWIEKSSGQLRFLEVGRSFFKKCWSACRLYLAHGWHNLLPHSLFKLCHQSGTLFLALDGNVTVTGYGGVPPTIFIIPRKRCDEKIRLPRL